MFLKNVRKTGGLDLKKTALLSSKFQDEPVIADSLLPSSIP